MEQHDIDARLARLEARRQAATAPARRRPHVAHRSRIGVTVGSVLAMAGLTGGMAIADQAASASVATVTDVTVARSSSTTDDSAATTITAAAAATPSTVAATQTSGS